MPDTVFPSPGSTAVHGPLAGVRILDLTSVVLGPFATQILGDYGADVIKVETPEGDLMRANGVSLHAGMSSVFLAINRNKRSIALDLKAAEGREILRRLIPPLDSTSADVPVPDYTATLDNDVAGKTIGVPRALLGEGLDDEVREKIHSSIDNFEKLGANIVDVELPYANYGIAVYYIIATAEASSNLARFDGVRYGFRAEDAPGLREMYFKTREEGFGAEVKRRIMLGTYVLSSGYYDAYYSKAQKVRALVKRDYATAFEKCDAILTPTSPSVAFKLGEKSDDPLAMYLNDIYTVSANLAGVPAISVPCGLSGEGLPIGVQLVGNFWSEDVLLNLASKYETAFPLEAKPSIYVG